MISQLTVFLENEKGRLAAACRAVADAGINMHSLFLADTQDFGVLRLLVDNPKRAVEALREAGFDVMKAENMELLTVRGYTDELWRRYARGPQVFVRQATQSTVRVVRKRE